jgi:CRISPR-associated protein Cmr3
MSHEYLIEPLAPLVFRSGKPFGSEVGADGANFPLPSSLAGLIRTVYADQNQKDFVKDKSHLMEQQVIGPLLLRYGETTANILLPKPADAIYLQGEDGSATELVRLSPKPLANGVGCDLPQGLVPVQLENPEIKGKPQPGPQFWSLENLIEWQQGSSLNFESVEKNGLKSVPQEIRTHVSIDKGSQASAAGKLFQTASLDFGAQRNDHHQGWSETRLGFWAKSSALLKEDLVTFGGERRLSRIKSIQVSNTNAPKDLAEQVRQKGGLKLTLITPALFDHGSLPAWLDQSLEGEIPNTGLRVRLVAQAIERWLPVSGFDLQLWKPKVMRKAVAAGAVYWFKVVGTVPDNLSATLWLQSISDHAQDRCDSFGLVVPSAWQPTV